MPYSHPQPIEKSQATRRIRHLLPGAMALAGLAGYINSVALEQYHRPVSHMTGAISHLGVDLSEGTAVDAMSSLSIVLGFMAGAVLSGALVGAWKLVPSRRYGVALMLEGMLLAVATGLLLSKHRHGLPLMAMACGLQNAMTSSYCGLMIRTTHVTGMVTDLGVMLGHWLRHGQIEWWKWCFLSLVFLSFGTGGWLGAWANLHYGVGCLGIAAGAFGAGGFIFWLAIQLGWLKLAALPVADSPQHPVFPVIRKD